MAFLRAAFIKRLGEASAFVGIGVKVTIAHQDSPLLLD